MNTLFKNIKAMVGVVAMTALVATSFVSCSYDDTDLRRELEEIRQELADLRQSVESELSAIRDLINGQLTITKVEPQSDGSTVLVLSDGTRITVQPKAAGVPEQIVTVISENNTLYWAMYVSGEATPIYINGQMVPVADVAPQTRVNNDTKAIEVSFDGGNTWVETGYSQSVADSLIADIEVVYSDWQTDAEGNPLALYCIIELSDGTQVKVGMQNGKIILPYDMVFVAYGSEMTFNLEVADAADFMTTTPRGWECDVEHDAKNGQMTLCFYAPEYEAIESGAAVREGVAKLMVVFNNGSSAIASIKLTTNPAEVNFTMEGIHLEVGYGTNYLLCGLVTASSYNASTIITNCNRVLQEGSTISSVYQVSFMETTTTYIPYKELRSSNLSAGSEYIFWYVAPRTDEDGMLYVAENEIVPETYKHSSVTFEATETSFFDAEVKLTVKGSAGYMLGIELASEFDAAELAAYYTENYDYLNASGQDTTYSGSLLELLGRTALPLDYGTEYVVYYIAKSKTHTILEDNVLYWEFSTRDFTNDGDIEVVVEGEPTVDYKYIEMTLNTAEPHIMMFYNAMPSYMASAYPTDEYIIEMLLTEGKEVNSADAVLARYDGVSAGTQLTFFAVAVDAEGRIGKPFKQEFTTKDFVYNELTPALTLVDYKVDDTKIGVECADAAYFKYIVAQVNGNDWTEHYGGSARKAGEYIIINPSASDVYDTRDSRYALIDGNICLSGLNTDTEYVVLVMAADANDVLSKPVTLYFEPIANIGTMVKRTDDNWAEGKPTITLGDVEEIEFFSFEWFTTPQEGYVAYSMAEHPGNFVSDYYNTNVNTPEKLIAYIIAGCDNGTRDCGHRCEYSADGYSRTWREMEDLNGDGRIEDEWVEYREDGLPGVYNFYFYGTKNEHRIYITWVGPDGNFHEPFVFNPTTGEEEELNYDNFYL